MSAPNTNLFGKSFRQLGCYLVPKITTDSQQQTMNEGAITAESHRNKPKTIFFFFQEKADAIFKDGKVGLFGTGAKSFSSLNRSKAIALL